MLLFLYILSSFILSLLIIILFFLFFKISKRKKIIKVLKNDKINIIKEDIKEDKNDFLENLISKTGLKLDKSFFILISIIFSITTFIFLNFLTKSIIISLMLSLFSLLTPLLILNFLKNKRSNNFNIGLKLIINKTTSMLKSGVGFEEAFKKSILTTRDKTTRDIFMIYVNEKEIIGEDRAFEKMFEKIESKELQIFYLVVKIGRESGGKFSNTLEALSLSLENQENIKRDIVASTKETKIGTAIILLITVALFFAFDSVFDGKIQEYFFTTDNGKVQFFLILVWVFIGLAINQFLSKIKV